MKLLLVNILFLLKITFPKIISSLSKEISSLSTQTGSVIGGTKLTIEGPFLYTDNTVPADIKIAGKPCTILSYAKKATSQTDGKAKITCEVAPNDNTAATEYSGNRGITLIEDSIFTSSASLETIAPSSSATYSQINKASYSSSAASDKTVWLKGFLAPGKTSEYEFEIVSNGNGVLFISTDNTSANKVKVASTSTNTKGKLTLDANKL